VRLYALRDSLLVEKINNPGFAFWKERVWK
jgi:hypothetical protein